MIRLLKAIGRLFRNIFAKGEGTANRASKKMMTDTDVLRARYDEVIDSSTTQIQALQSAVGRKMGIASQKEGKIKDLEDKIERLRKLCAAAKKKSDGIIEDMIASGKTREDAIAAAKRKPAVKELLTAYKDYSTTLKAREEELVGQKQDYSRTVEEIEAHKRQLSQLKRKLEETREKAVSAEANILSAQESKKIDDMISGISTDESAKTLKTLEDIEREALAQAQISKEMAGTDAKLKEEELLASIDGDDAEDDFFK